jgi:Uma2 family endonuclease
MALVYQAPAMTVGEFVEWASRQPEGRYELVDGEVVRMPSEGGDHNRVKFRLAKLLDDAVEAARLSCVVYTDGMTVETTPGRGRGPDAIVSVGPPEDPKAKIVPDPLVLVEVISPDSYIRDMSTKLAEYARIPTVRHSVVVDLEARLIIHHRRTDDGTIVTRPIAAGDLELDPPGLVIPVARVFDVLQG